MHRIARAALVVPNGHAMAKDSVLGVQTSAEGIIVNAPVTVDGGLVASHGSDAHISRELGLAECGMANITPLPGLETDACNREAGVDTQGEGGRGGQGLCCVSNLDTPMHVMGGTTLEKCILVNDCGCLVKKVSLRLGKALKRVSMAEYLV